MPRPEINGIETGVGLNQWYWLKIALVAIVQTDTIKLRWCKV